ncbi:MAG: membrane protein insertase YidC [Arenicellales bacterium]
MDVRRGILLFALALILVVLYQRWLVFTTPQTPQTAQAPAPAAQTSGTKAPSATAGSEQVPEVPEAPSGEAKPETGSQASGKAEKGTGAEAPTGAVEDLASQGPHIEVTTDVYRAEIDAQGGGIAELAMLKHPVSVNHPNQPFLLLKREQTDNGPEIFITESGLIGKGREFPNHKTKYQIDRTHYSLQPGSNTVTVDLHWTAPDNVRYTKRFTFSRNSYEIKVDYLVDNRSSTPWTGFVYAQFLRTHFVPHRNFLQRRLPIYTGGAIYSPKEKFEKVSFSDIKDKALKRRVADGWVAMIQHYFVTGWFPRDDSEYSFYTRYLKGESPRYAIGLNSLTPATAAPGQSVDLGLNMFAGPKEQNLLAKTAKGFDLTVDYGYLTPVSSPLFWVLDHIHDVIGNWGWSIIILTCLIKAAFYPLSATSYKSMAKMKKLQPRLQTLKERYGDDKTKYNQAMMEIYKKEKVNPLGGCLPIVIQIPVFIALYWVLLGSVELRQAPWLLWIQDLSVRDPYYVLPILMGVTMVAQQLLNPSPVDPMQKKLMMALPAVFTFLFLYFPAGLVLYWLTNNILSITQQWYINKHVV